MFCLFVRIFAQTMIILNLSLLFRCSDIRIEDLKKQDNVKLLLNLMLLFVLLNFNVLNISCLF